MGVVQARVAGCPIILFRISFSGELAYEIATGADHGKAVWEALMAAGREEEIIPYGTEAMAVMRIEKGHAAGPELSGQTTAQDLGLGKLCSTKKPYIGHRLKDRPATADPHRPALVGLVSLEPGKRIPGGAQLVEDPNHKAPIPMLGYATSPTYSITLDKYIALALLKDGKEREDDLYAANPLGNTTTRFRSFLRSSLTLKERPPCLTEFPLVSAYRPGPYGAIGATGPGYLERTTRPHHAPAGLFFRRRPALSAIVHERFGLELPNVGKAQVANGVRLWQALHAGCCRRERQHWNSSPRSRKLLRPTRLSPSPTLATRAALFV